MRLPFADFYVVTVYPVVTELQGRNLRTFFLALFEVDEKLIGVLCDRAQFIEFVIVTIGNDATMTGEHGWIVDQSLLQQVLFARVALYLFEQSRKQR